jgi:hypothetical protein
LAPPDLIAPSGEGTEAMATFDDKIHGLEMPNDQLLVANGMGGM